MTGTSMKETARKLGIDLVGIASMDRFTGLPPQFHPASIFPEARSVVVLAREIPRGMFRGVEEGTLWTRAPRQIPPVLSYNLGRLIEDAGYVAVPVSPLAEERWPDGIPFGDGKVAPNVSPSLEYAAVAAGLGEIGYCRIFLTPHYGSRQSLGMIITDAEWEPDPLFAGRICEREGCHECAAGCPLGAISREKTETVEMGGRKMECGLIDYRLCRLCPNGTFPDTSYTGAKPNRLTAACNRACLAHLESAGVLGKKYRSPFRKREPWKLGITDV